MRARPGYAEMILCTLTWGSIGSIVRQITLPASVIVFFRLALGAVVVIAWLAARGRLDTLRPHGRAPLLAGSGVTLAVHWVLLFAAYQRIGVVTTILIVFVGPVLWAAAAPTVLREPLRAVSVVALFAAFGGIAMISVPDIGRLDAWGLVAAFVSAVLFAVLVLMGKVLTRAYEPGAIAAWQLGIGALLLSPVLAGASGEQVARALPLLLVLGMLHTGALAVLFFRAVRALPAQRLGVLFYLEPASAVFYAWLFLSEPLSALTLAGGALVLAAGVAIITTDRTPGSVPDPVTLGEAG